MRLIQKNEWKDIVCGANLLGTGGGGTIAGALSILKNVKPPVTLTSIDELNDRSLACSVFGVGGKQVCDPIIASKNALSLFQKILGEKISVIVSVEVGPMSIANTIFISGNLNIPILDSDIVGLRSSPEVFLETISIAGLKRTPCVIADDKGNSAILRKSREPKELDKFFRDFAISVGGDAYVAGYPLKIGSLKNIVPKDSITISQDVGEQLKKLKRNKINLGAFCKTTQWELLNTGQIIEQIRDDSGGFSKGRYRIESDKDMFEVLFKNENLVLLKNDRVSLTCPDSISLLDLANFEGINNFEDNSYKKVAILGKKAIPIWRTSKGKKLFSPKNLGLDYKQTLLK